jgi:hypothetical protein
MEDGMGSKNSKCKCDANAQEIVSGRLKGRGNFEGKISEGEITLKTILKKLF